MEMVGTGYRASSSGQELTLNVGYSKPRVLAIPDGLSVKVGTQLTAAGVEGLAVNQGGWAFWGGTAGYMCCPSCGVWRCRPCYPGSIWPGADCKVRPCRLTGGLVVCGTAGSWRPAPLLLAASFSNCQGRTALVPRQAFAAIRRAADGDLALVQPRAAAQLVTASMRPIADSLHTRGVVTGCTHSCCCGFL
jgi:hypothetical protein